MQHIIINSKDRTSSSNSTSDFRIDFNTPIEGKYKLDFVSIPNTQYTVNSYNNTLQTSLGNITLTKGYYNAEDLASHIQTKLQAEDGNFTCTFSDVTKKYTITNTSSFTVTISTDNTTCGDLIGFSSDKAAATSQTGDNIADLTPLKTVILNIKECLNSVELSSSVNRGIYLPITNSFGSYQYYYQNEINDILSIKHTKQLNIILHDLDGNTLELNGINIFIKLSKL